MTYHEHWEEQGRRLVRRCGSPLDIGEMEGRLIEMKALYRGQLQTPPVERKPRQ